MTSWAWRRPTFCSLSETASTFGMHLDVWFRFEYTWSIGSDAPILKTTWNSGNLDVGRIQHGTFPAQEISSSSNGGCLPICPGYCRSALSNMSGTCGGSSFSWSRIHSLDFCWHRTTIKIINNKARQENVMIQRESKRVQCMVLQPEMEGYICASPETIAFEVIRLIQWSWSDISANSKESVSYFHSRQREHYPHEMLRITATVLRYWHYKYSKDYETQFVQYPTWFLWLVFEITKVVSFQLRSRVLLG